MGGRRQWSSGHGDGGDQVFGTQAVTFTGGVVLGRDGRTHRTLRVARGVIDRLDASAARGDVVVDLEGAVVVPGLINAHDHLGLNSLPRMKWRPRYTNVRAWIDDFQPRFRSDPHLATATSKTLADRLWVGGLKNLFSGVTTVCHHDPLHRPLRRAFPVCVVRRFGMSHSLAIDGGGAVASYRATPSSWPWIIHAAEGVDEEAAREVDMLLAAGCIGPNTVLVHGVGIVARQAEELLARGAALVWCATSNEFLFGRTADVTSFDRRRRLAIGTDSRLSGLGDLLDELRAARGTHQLSPEALVRSVTENAARMLRLGDAGTIDVGQRADLTIIDRVASDPFEALVSACRTNVRLVMSGGVPLFGDERMRHVFAARRQPCRRVRVDGAPRLLAAWIARHVARLRMREPGLELEEQ